ncbi:MAG: M14 family metallopeptidase [Clostridiales bacterium]
MSKQELWAGEMSAKPGEKVQGFITVTGTDYRMPATLINGAGQGKTFLITAGIHGGEYPSIQAAIDLANELRPEEIKGQIIIVPIVNPPAFQAKLSYINPLDGKNINRQFPGDPEGTISQQIAWFITQELQGQADFYVDLHGGDIHEELPPYVYYPGIASPEVTAASRAMAVKLKSDFMVKSSATTGAYNSAAIRGLPCLLIERGSSGLWSPQEVELYKKDILTVMRAQGLTEDGEVAPDQEPMEITKAVYLDSTCTGCWYPAVSIKEKVKKGQKIGEIRDVFGQILETYHADFDSMILFIATSLAIGEGDPIITYGI